MSLARRTTGKRNIDNITANASNNEISQSLQPPFQDPKKIKFWRGKLNHSQVLRGIFATAITFFLIFKMPSFLEKTVPGVSSISSSYNPIVYQINITKDAKFSDNCHQQIHTFEFKDSKVKWVNGGYSYFSRGMSTHCMLARAAKRLGPEFTLSMRITTADKDLNSTLAFGPAATDQQMKMNKVPPLLFPDSTWESWPEIYDYSLPKSVAKVRRAAEDNGLPGSPKWFKRKPQLLWRGSKMGKTRIEMINVSLTSSLLDIKDTHLNITEDQRIRLKSPNTVTREEHCQYRFLLHMNGEFNNRYSSAVKWKLLCGSLVFVPVKPLFVEWWNYQTWKPNVHFVPYESTEDLLEKVKYYSKHLDEAASIAQRGMELAQAAFNEAPHFIDSTLRRYKKLTGHLPRKACAAPRIGKDAGTDYEFKSLEDLKKEYGPEVCS